MKRVFGLSSRVAARSHPTIHKDIGRITDLRGKVNVLEFYADFLTDVDHFFACESLGTLGTVVEDREELLLVF